MKNQYYFPNLQIGYTSIPKCACSTMKRSLLHTELSGAKDSLGGDIHKTAKEYSVCSLSKFENSIKILVIRDPLDRLLSAYLDKFVTASENPENFTKEFCAIADIKISDITFHSFLKALEVMYANATKEVNEHWASQFDFIEANLKYDFVIDFQDLKILSELKFGIRTIPLLNIVHHSTPKSSVYMEQAEFKSSSFLLKYRKQHNKFPSLKSFTDGLKVDELSESVIRENRLYRNIKLKGQI